MLPGVALQQEVATVVPVALAVAVAVVAGRVPVAAVKPVAVAAPVALQQVLEPLVVMKMVLVDLVVAVLGLVVHYSILAARLPLKIRPCLATSPQVAAAAVPPVLMVATICL